MNRNFFKLMRNVNSLEFMGYTFYKHSAVDNFNLEITIGSFKVLFIVHHWGHLEIGLKIISNDSDIVYKKTAFAEFFMLLSFIKTAYQYNDYHNAPKNGKVCADDIVERAVVPVLEALYDELFEKAANKRIMTQQSAENRATIEEMLERFKTRSNS